jgi:hypothetical protein
VKTFAEIVAALDRPLVARNAAWTLAQHLDHCAESIAASVDGYPALKPALVRGTIGKLVKRRFLARGAMRHDTAAPLPGGVAPPPRALDDARDSLRAAIERFRRHRGPFALHPVYGRCTADEYEALHAMHVADHLSLA